MSNQQLCFSTHSHQQMVLSQTSAYQPKHYCIADMEKRQVFQSYGSCSALKFFLEELEQQSLKDCFLKWLENDLIQGFKIKKQNFLSNWDKVNIQQRAQLVQQIVLLHRKLKLKNIVVFHAVKVLDHYLLAEKYQIPINGHLLPINCLIISHKHFNMRRIRISKWLQLLDFRQDQYPVDQIIENQGRILDVLGFNIEFPISFQIASFLSKALKLSQKSLMFMRYLLELSFFLEPFQFMEKQNPFLVGVSCVHLSCFFLQPELWNNDLLQPFQISNQALQQYCGNLFNAVANAQKQAVFAVVYNKFKKKCYKNVAQIRFCKHEPTEQEVKQKNAFGSPETCCDDEANQFHQVSFDQKSERFLCLKDSSNVSEKKPRKGTLDEININSVSTNNDECFF